MADILKNVRFFAGAADMTGQANKVEISPEAEEKDVTTFGSYDPATDRVWKQVVAGLKSSKGNASGFWQAGDPGLVDDAAWAALGGMSAWTICPRGAAVGDPAYVTRALQGSYQLLGAPGDIAPWSAAWSSSYPVGRGVVLHPPGPPAPPPATARPCNCRRCRPAGNWSPRCTCCRSPAPPRRR
ncbi:hypothetical protein GA0074692_6798 [Micromonospora pallida]|uniref:Uncharacterized protein n=1 Tax=Micromonospora pallida TaxID=145854 RepID=A0A1C6TNE8_9ACTN|nr:hypothetical protein [Micromonospora pallida]SCL43270.1 hypothetical protein GA0074692_6798 [Micromonospora pallida]